MSEREKPNVPFHDANKVLEGREMPFNVIGLDTYDGLADVLVSHPTSTGGPLYMRGTAKRQNGESHQELLFGALKDAVGLREGSGVKLSDHGTNPETGETHVTVVDFHGDIWTANGTSFVDAAANSLAAIQTKQDA